MEFSQFINYFDSVKSIGKNQYMVKCPSHDDKKQSLSICDQTTEHGNILINCFAGCSSKDILEKVGLKISDLYRNHDMYNTKLHYDLENIIYRYEDEYGELLFEKIRTPDKKFFNRRYLEDSIIWGLTEGRYWKNPNKNEYTKDNKYGSNESIYLTEQPKTLYKLPQLIRAVNERKEVFIVEGEKDVETMLKHGFCATTTSNGGGFWDSSFNKYFIGASVIVLLDNDDTGQKFGHLIKKELLNYIWRIKTITISKRPKGDVTDYFDEGNSNKDLLQTIELVQWELPKWQEFDKSNKIKINPGMLAETIKKGISFKFVGDGGNNILYLYEDGYYKETTLNNLKKNIAKYIIPYYQNRQLIDGVLSLLQNEKSYNYNDFDKNSDIINLKNGIYNIKEKRMHNHSPETLSLVQINAEYNPNYKNLGYWDKFIDYMVNYDKHLKAIIQEFTGLALSNYIGAFSKKMLILTGNGDTGKSKYLQMLQYLLGQQSCINVPVQNLSEKFILGSLGSSRLVHDADLPSKGITDSSLSILKKLTGGDKISVQKKNKDVVDVFFKGVVAYACNKIPTLEGDLGEHVFNRFLIIPCNSTPIPEEKQIKNFINYLKLDSSYIINWALVGLERLVNNNFNFTKSDASQKASIEFRNNIDSVKAFIDDLIYSKYLKFSDNKQDKIKTTQFYNIYKTWTRDNDYDIAISKSQFAERLNSNYNIKRSKYNGVWYYPYLVWLGEVDGE